MLFRYRLEKDLTLERRTKRKQHDMGLVYQSYLDIAVA
jgi:hypothetical protein